MTNQLSGLNKTASRLEKNVGGVFKVPINDVSHVYAVFLNDFTYQFWGKLFNENLPTLSSLLQEEPLFRVHVMSMVQIKKMWPLIGKLPVEGWLSENAYFCRRVLIGLDADLQDICEFYLTNELTSVKISELECAKYEEYVVWTPEEIVARILGKVRN